MADYEYKATFSDVGLTAGTSSTYELVQDEASINQNIMMIVSTPVRSKWWRPEIGANLNTYLFEPIDDITSSKIQTELSSILDSNLENRVVFQKIEVIPDVSNQNYYVEVIYTIPALQGKLVNFAFTLGRNGGS